MKVTMKLLIDNVSKRWKAEKVPPPAPVTFPEKTVMDQVSGHLCKQQHHSTVDRALHKRSQQFYGLWDGEEDTE